MIQKRGIEGRQIKYVKTVAQGRFILNNFDLSRLEC